MEQQKPEILPSGKKIYPCGCVEGNYWCAKHDIYVRQDKKHDPRWNGLWDYGDAYFEGEPVKPDGCYCHISAPCSFCTWDADNDADEQTAAKL